MDLENGVGIAHCYKSKETRCRKIVDHALYSHHWLIYVCT